ncbi:Kinesin-like protein KIN-14I [Merluccius polli]|uniref:Kinesin-like protein KIN-14I n=1 Tax=Merluccius polli TaxID=89951 RepID=A0AA47P6G9_MERPO|nr:Kinesin-like protein KIN-14I [Merluccius polli]
MSMKTAASVPFLCSPAAYRALASLSASSRASTTSSRSPFNADFSAASRGYRHNVDHQLKVPLRVAQPRARHWLPLLPLPTLLPLPLLPPPPLPLPLLLLLPLPTLLPLPPLPLPPPLPACVGAGGAGFPISSYASAAMHCLSCIVTMYLNSPGSERGSLSLTFLGKKVGRHHAVAPAGKQHAWETTNRSTGVEESTVSSRVVHAPVAGATLEDLPGSVPDLREEPRGLRACPVYSTRIDQDPDNTAVAQHKALWLKRWEAFCRWIAADHRKRPGQEGEQAPHIFHGAKHFLPSVEGSEVDPGMEGEDVRIYIPYESAELCITQVAKDMEAMKSRHLEMVRELEESFQIAARENQERTVQQIRAHYQSKMNALKKILGLYQEKVEKKDTEWHKKVLELTAQREQLLEEQGAERTRCKEEVQQWHREKSKMLELFSNRLDLLHSHQASTLQELQMARQEVGKVQEMLTASQEERQEATKEGDTPENNEPSEQPVACSEQEPLPLEGAKARLEELKESLYQREREITELLGADGGPAPQPPCAMLLPVVIQKAHAICLTVPEARTQLEQMMEENRASLLQARDKLEHLKTTTEDQSPTEEDTAGPTELSVLEDTVRECEVIQMALNYIRTGRVPVNSECNVVELELEGMLGQETIQTTEGVKTVGQQLLVLQDQLKQVREENKKIIENYTSERTLRKKFYNMVEDMRGKIRVFCRIRPVSRTEAAQGGVIVVERLDDYSVAVETPRGLREFNFDKVFGADSSQEELFQDTHRMIQSAIDGFNVCIFAYGQTGSGKTFTMVGDKEHRNPGIMPRTFTAMFDIIQVNGTRFDSKVSAYMLELYNDQLQDLLAGVAGEASATQAHAPPPRRLEIKRNRKGVVFAQGAETKQVCSAQELFALFQQACANRHISSTKMNSESSRSHLIMGIMVESRNLTNGSVSCGKLSLVDLAGSERAAKTGAKDHQLKEANSINKSLSALGDVISALSSELPHVPYRNSKLTQVMQDSLGGNAKTLMIVNISPAEGNMEETLTSLIYATRVKAITNHAQKNLESKEIAQLKEVIVKLKSGQTVEEEDV